MSDNIKDDFHGIFLLQAVLGSGNGLGAALFLALRFLACAPQPALLILLAWDCNFSDFRGVARTRIMKTLTDNSPLVGRR